MLSAGRRFVAAAMLGVAVGLAGTGSALAITLVDTSSGAYVFNPPAVPSRINYARVFQSFDFVTDATVTDLTWYGQPSFAGSIGLYDDNGKMIYSTSPVFIPTGFVNQWVRYYRASGLNWGVQKSRRYWISVFGSYDTGYWEWTTSNASDAIAYTLVHSPTVDASENWNFRDRGQVLTFDGIPTGVAFKIEGIEQVTAIPVPPALPMMLTAVLGFVALSGVTRHGARHAKPPVPRP